MIREALDGLAGLVLGVIGLILLFGLASGRMSVTPESGRGVVAAIAAINLWASWRLFLGGKPRRSDRSREK